MTGEVAEKLARVREAAEDLADGLKLAEAPAALRMPLTAAEHITAGSAFAWNPTVRGAKSEDTFLISGDGAAVALTNTPDWPVVAGPASRPAILSR